MGVRVGPWRRLNTEELMLLDCGAGEDSWESLGLQGDQPILKEINPEYSLEGLMLKLKLQYFGHPIQRGDSLEKTLMLGKIEGNSRMGRQKMRGLMTSLTQWPWVWANPGRYKEAWYVPGSQRVGHDWVTELNWTWQKTAKFCKAIILQ